MVRPLFLALSLLFIGCFNIMDGGDPPPDGWNYYEKSVTPVTITRDSLRQSVYSTTPQELKNPGKIYIRGKYLYVNERYRGVHVIDNSDPSKPSNIAFIHIPGNIDIVMRSTILYADNATDMVTINITDPKSAIVTNRVEKAFPALPLPSNSYTNRYPSDGLVIVNWKDTVYN